MHHKHFSPIWKSSIALASMLGISSVIGVQALPFISPELNGRPRPSSPEHRGYPPLSWRATSTSYQPPGEPVSEPAQEPNASDFPPSLQPQSTPPDLENDPVFQEIKKAFMPGANKQSQPTEADGSSIASIPDGQWHAAEHLLRAARELEVVESVHLQNRNASQATKAREWIRQIRTTASQLIQAP